MAQNIRMGQGRWTRGWALIGRVVLLLSVTAVGSCRQSVSPPARGTVSGSAPAPATPIKGIVLLAGARWEFSTDGGQSWEAKCPDLTFGVPQLSMRATFSAGAEPFAGLEVQRSDRATWSTTCRINGQVLTPPSPASHYRYLPGPAELIRKGDNLLEMQILPRQYICDEDLAVTVRGLRARDLEITTGPMLGAAGEDGFSVTCRTNLPVPVELTAVREQDLSTTATAPASAQAGPATSSVPAPIATSPAGFLHSFRVTGLKPGRYVCTLSAGAGDCVAMEHFTAHTLPASGGKLRFVALGDNRGSPDMWEAVAKAALAARPELLVHTGDMVSSGSWDWLWDEEFWLPARELLAAVPLYAVEGNHETQGDLKGLLLVTPGQSGRDKNWSQQVRDVLLIGIDGTGDWTAGRDNAAWLERQLASSRAKFIFLITHYPALTSGEYGAGKVENDPRGDEVVMARVAIVPLLRKYEVTAMIAGHDHDYERSEIPGEAAADKPEDRNGLTVIVTGGAGAPLRKRYDTSSANNPYSKLFVSDYHICILEADGGTCRLEAKALDGRLLDSRQWPARQASVPKP